MEILILLGIITLIELYRIWAIVKPETKALHFKNKLKGTEKMRWDLEFKASKTMQIREDIRKEYDHMKSVSDTIEKQLVDFKGKKEEKATLEDKKALAERDTERLLNQIKALDMEVNGCKPSNEYPDGHTGIKDNIASLAELEGMLKVFIKSL